MRQQWLDKHQNANLKYFEMGGTILEIAKQAWRIYTNRYNLKNPSDDNMVNDKRLLLSLLFSNTKINGEKTEISYQKPFKMIFDRVSEITGEKMDEKTIFELTKKPVNKKKSRAFGSAHPIWLRRLYIFRTVQHLSVS
jgi:hypothetical protein